DLAHLAADALGIARGQGLGLEHLQRLALERRPRAGRRIAAADEIVNLPPGLAPVDAGIVAPAAALIGCLRVILLDARRLARVGPGQPPPASARRRWETAGRNRPSRASRRGRYGSSSAAARRRYRARCRARRSTARSRSRLG